jgi:hypothetical protein
MTEKDEQLKQFREAVDRKSEAAEAASRATEEPAGEGTGGANPATQRNLVEDSGPQEALDPRAKSRQKGKVTADKWNQ